MSSSHLCSNQLQFQDIGSGQEQQQEESIYIPPTSHQYLIFSVRKGLNQAKTVPIKHVEIRLYAENLSIPDSLKAALVEKTEQ